MNEYESYKLTPFNLMCILIGVIFGLNVITLPNAMVEIVKQDGWISAALGVIYPIYISIITIYISKKYPNDNILSITKKYLGNLLGNILNFLFFLNFFVYFPSIISNGSIMMRTYIVGFMTNMQIYIVLVVIGAYVAYKGLDVLKKICTINFCIIVIIMVISLLILERGSILNMMPVFQMKLSDIFKASSTSLYDYGGLEVALLLYPFVNDKKQVNKIIIKSTFFICFVYTWIVFVTIYYLGIDIIPKTIWGFFTATESIRFEIINSFRYVFIFLWVFILIKSVSVFYYICVFILKDMNKKFNSKLTYIGIGIITIFFTYNYYGERLAKNQIVNYTVKFSTIYSLCYITFIAILIFIKENKK